MTETTIMRARKYALYRFCATILFASVSVSIVSLASSSNTSKLVVLHSFAGGADGQYPEAGLLQDASGNLYGATQTGGGQPDAGTIFTITSSDQETVLYSFGPQPDGQEPSGPVVRDNAGNLYGTTIDGGSSAFGTVFKLTNSGIETILYNFLGGTDGANPRGGLLLDSKGNLYGTTVQGGGGGCGLSGCGTVFKVAPDGAETTLHSFTASPDGANPEKGLIRDAAGNLYGTTFTGGAYNYGTIYEISSAETEEVLYSFTGPPSGAYPWGSPLRDSAGNFYGTTLAGGTSTLCSPGCGTIFRLNASGEITVLHSFSGNADGDQPYGNLVRDNKGNLYGTTFGGGNSACDGGGGCGTVFELSSKGKFVTLHAFQGAEDGANPYDGVIVSKSGSIFGTTYFGGANDLGVVFKLAP